MGAKELLNRYGDELHAAAEQPTSRRSVTFDYEDILAVDESLARKVLTRPKRTRGGLAQLINDEYPDSSETTVRVGNIPASSIYRVGKYRTPDLGHLIGVEGEVVNASAVEPFAREAALECQRCGTMTYLPQTFGRMDEPTECMGCEHKNPGYKFYRPQSDIIDYREVTLIPAATNLEDPPTLTCTLKEDLVDNIGPGDVATLIGEYDTAKKQSKAALRTYLDVWTVEGVQAGETDKLSAADLDELIVTETQDRQTADSTSFGAFEEDVVEHIAESNGVRREEVRTRMDALKDCDDVHEVGGGRIMVN